MSWRTGPCAVILAAAPRPRRARPLLPPLAVWGLPTLAVLLAVLLAVGPVVRRIRRLTRAVDDSADAGWDGTIPVHGRDELGELARAFEAAGREIAPGWPPRRSASRRSGTSSPTPPTT